MLEIDLHNCRLVTDQSITSLLARGRQLRELRMNHCKLVTDHAFLDLPKTFSLECLRILDLTGCEQLHDEAVEKIVDAAPRLRNLVLAKCREITDRAVFAITKLGKNLHYIHLGHCGRITDDAVKELVKCCNRIRYIDLACCQALTDTSVTLLAGLPKLRRIGLVKCGNITDRSILALAQKGRPGRQPLKPQPPSLLERVHLSYCVALTLQGIHALLNQCPKLTHLSLTGVAAFYLREDLMNFIREAPAGMTFPHSIFIYPNYSSTDLCCHAIAYFILEFTDHQRNVFCVFSGDGVNRLRNYLNEDPAGIYDTEGTMYDDREIPEGDNDHQVASLMHMAGINDDEDGEDDPEAGDGSDYGAPVEG